MFFIFHLTYSFANNVNNLRIVTLAPNLTEIVFALGLEKNLVGNTILCDYPLEAKSVYKIGNFNNPSIERIIALKANVVLATEGNPDDKLKILSKNNIKVIKIQPEIASDIPLMIKKISLELGVEQKGKVLAEKIMFALLKIKQKQISENRKFLFILQFDPMYTVSEETWLGSIFKLAGMRNLIGESQVKYPKISNEFLLKNIPDIIFLGQLEGKNEKESLKYYQKKINSIYGKIKHNIKIIVVPKDILVRPGPRLIDGIQFIESV